jgi:CDP-diacylglycerol--glycerol-3-phosphate 3-phosphatidyltransferase
VIYIPSRTDITVPNALTCFRIFLAGCAAVLFASGSHTAAATWICIVASLLDYFDGWYARRYKQKTRLGMHLDPFADKVLIGVIFIAAAAALQLPWFYLFVMLVLLREIAITIYRYVIRKRFGLFTPASGLGRAKTFIQCVVGNGLLFYIFVHPGKVPERNLFLFIIMIVTLSVTIDSGLCYILPECRDGKKRSVFERLMRRVSAVKPGEV